MLSLDLFKDSRRGWLNRQMDVIDFQVDMEKMSLTGLIGLVRTGEILESVPQWLSPLFIARSGSRWKSGHRPCVEKPVPLGRRRLYEVRGVVTGPASRHYLLEVSGTQDRYASLHLPPASTLQHSWGRRWRSPVCFHRLLRARSRTHCGTRRLRRPNELDCISFRASLES
jgi:hypothetical protein